MSFTGPKPLMNQKTNSSGLVNCKKRILKDVINIMKNPLHDQGIYYKHDENDIRIGQAMIIGPKDTPYQNGMYFFNFCFPLDYPFSPPKLTYHTNGLDIRFNPNLYEDGKVCLSILNTWRGEQWTSCQTISSVLLTLVSILIKEPFLNEPHKTKKSRDFKTYHKIVEWGNINVAIYGVLKMNFSFFSDLFKQEILSHIQNNNEEIKQQIKTLNKKYKKYNGKSKSLKTKTYEMEIYPTEGISVSDYECYKEAFFVINKYNGDNDTNNNYIE